MIILALEGGYRVDVVAIGYMIHDIFNFVGKVGNIIQGFWLIYLLFLIIAALITKSPLTKMKRNMILVKCIGARIYAYFTLPLIAMVKVGLYNYQLFAWFAVSILIIILMAIYIGILLFYSGTPCIFFQQEVKYSWPLSSFINREKSKTEV